MKGDFFVNKDCMECGMCVDELPSIFGIKGDRAYVKRQPRSKEEKASCMYIRDICPMNAIKKKLK